MSEIKDQNSRGKILIMEDDPLIRESSKKMLEKFIYEVELAWDGDEAICLYKKAKESNKPFNVIVMDLIVPGGMGGKEAFQRLLEFDPKVKTIITSGCFDDYTISEYKGYGFSGVISKPYDLDELDQIIQNIMMNNE
ncbi:MAG: response regulator [bacterium]